MIDRARQAVHDAEVLAELDDLYRPVTKAAKRAVWEVMSTPDPTARAIREAAEEVKAAAEVFTSQALPIIEEAVAQEAAAGRAQGLSGTRGGVG